MTSDFLTGALTASSIQSRPVDPGRQAFAQTVGLIEAHRDVLDARPGDGDAEAVLDTRHWAGFLLALDDDRLTHAEVRGADAEWTDAPESLRTMVEGVRRACSIAPFEVRRLPRRARRMESPRKQAQVDAFGAVILPLAERAARVVDVGSGHGHLTRDIAERVALPVIGLERDVELTARARSLSCTAQLSFHVVDVLRDGLTLSPSDCVVGLHACGELGDAMVEKAVAMGASIALCGCCLQKRRATARPSFQRPDLELPKRLLGLSNAAPGDEGVEATRAENVAARERRLSLHRLLSREHPGLPFGAEIAGINRRRAHDDLPVLVARAFEQRGLPCPSPAAIDEASAWARREHAKARRLALPRTMLARVLEVFVLLDRALHLEDHGFTVTIGTLFPSSISARNLALVAHT